MPCTLILFSFTPLTHHNYFRRKLEESPNAEKVPEQQKVPPIRVKIPLKHYHDWRRKNRKSKIYVKETRKPLSEIREEVPIEVPTLDAWQSLSDQIKQLPRSSSMEFSVCDPNVQHIYCDTPPYVIHYKTNNMVERITADEIWIQSPAARKNVVLFNVELEKGSKENIGHFSDTLPFNIVHYSNLPSK